MLAARFKGDQPQAVQLAVRLRSVPLVRHARDQGYRWFSRKRNVWPGTCRVDIRTAEGRTVGRVRFSVESAVPDTRAFETVRHE